MQKRPRAAPVLAECWPGQGAPDSVFSQNVVTLAWSVSSSVEPRTSVSDSPRSFWRCREHRKRDAHLQRLDVNFRSMYDLFCATQCHLRSIMKSLGVFVRRSKTPRREESPLDSGS
eukprot:Polyplicarium_translucidae@DN2344_c0_g1_i2.p1